MKSFRKLSLAAAISVGVLSIGGITHAQTNDTNGIIEVKQSSSCDTRTPSSYGAGPAGTFRTFGTENPGQQPLAAGSTEISTFKAQSTGAAASMAAQGIYGNCQPCQEAIPVAPVCPTSVIPVCPTGGAAGIINPTVSTPSDSNFTGGAAAAEAQGMTCVSVPVTPPSITGAAVPICPTPACIPQSCPGESRRATAPGGFKLPNNPNALAPYQAPACPTGCAAPVTPICPTSVIPVCPTGAAVQVIPVTPVVVPATVPAPVTTTEQNCIQQPLYNMYQPGSQACPTEVKPACPTQVKPACPSTCVPVTPVDTSKTSAMPAVIIPACPTGGAASVAGPVSGCCSGDSRNTKYVERQVYDYPSVYGSNSTVGAADQVLAFGDQLKGMSATSPLSTMAFSGYMPNSTVAYNMQNNLIGAAAPIYMPGTNIPMYVTGGASPINITGGAASACPGTGVTYSSGTPVSSLFVPEGSNMPMSIQTSSGYTLSRLVVSPSLETTTGAAASIPSQFEDIPDGYWAGNDINRLASIGILSGYPDRTFKPNLAVSRAEFSTMLVSGLNLQGTPVSNQQIFSDVPTNFWANQDISRAYSKGLVTGYPNNKFMPNAAVSVAEALTIMSKSISCDISADQACQILGKYSDASNIPAWATIPVAKALNAGLLQDFPNSNIINPNQSATRAQIASMLSNLRQSLALDPNPSATTTGAAANIQQETITIPTLNVKFDGRITANASHVGDRFTATTLEPVTINNQLFPAGSRVNGKIVEVVRPSGNNPGALKVAFTDINDKSSGTSAPLPKDIISARVMDQVNPNIVSRVIEFPFVWTGRLLGITGRTVGGATVVAANGSEQVLNGVGLAFSNLTSGAWSQSGRAAASSGIALVKTPFDMARTALSGASGLFNVTTDELSYLVNPSGHTVASIGPKETVSVAFGCNQ